MDVGGENVALSGLPATDEKECASHVWVFNAVDIFRPLYLYLKTCTGYIFIHFNALLWINYLNRTWFEELIFEPSCFVNHVLSFHLHFSRSHGWKRCLSLISLVLQLNIRWVKLHRYLLSISVSGAPQLWALFCWLVDKDVKSQWKLTASLRKSVQTESESRSSCLRWKYMQFSTI